MSIDLYTIQLAVSAVTIVAGVMFILDTFLRRTDGAGRLWAVAFMSGIVASFAYSTWVVLPGAWWAIAVGNACMVLTPALLWAGSRAYNGRPDAAWAAVGGAAVAAVAVLAGGPDGGDWAGAPAMFLLISLFSALAAAETLRAPMNEQWVAKGLTLAFSFVATFYAVRTTGFILLGPGDPWFDAFLGTAASAFVLISLVIVTVVAMVILQGERVPRAPRRGAPIALSYTPDAVLTAQSFREIVEDWLERANFHDEQLVFMRVELDELQAVHTAFGRTAAAELTARFVEAVRRYGSPHSDIGAVGEGALVLVAPFERMSDAEASAENIRTGLRENPIEASVGLRLSASIGLAGTDRFGYEFDRLMREAAQAGAQARALGGDEVVLAV
ncbi:diguanylate cyclase domain-containing protein [Agromyces sp. C10]|uniref:diguanylate cyclase domain-containing protein n=1 Tax=Agromyces sp. C10 TaxID=2935077 RepID=UPI00200ACD62|nr:diguanylate cyclase [Agromyces sp. C10]MCK8608266.1 diguanylate cyclase [Agromyces sp. C10]